MVYTFSKTCFAFGILFFKKLLLASCKIVICCTQQTVENVGANPASVALMFTLVMNLNQRWQSTSVLTPTGSSYYPQASRDKGTGYDQQLGRKWWLSEESQSLPTHGPAGKEPGNKHPDLIHWPKPTTADSEQGAAKWIAQMVKAQYVLSNFGGYYAVNFHSFHWSQEILQD